MILRRLTKEQTLRYRRKLLLFLRKHGDRRITRSALQWLERAEARDLSEEGTLILVALENRKLVGMILISRYGLREAAMAVHREYRNRNIAKALIHQTISTLGKMYGRVALDNLPSLKACLDNGMVGFHLFTGPTGKPTLWVGGGHWSKKEVLQYLASETSF